MIIIEENTIVVINAKTYYFNFDWPKYVFEKFKHEIEFIRKSNKSLAEDKIKTRLNNYC